MKNKTILYDYTFRTERGLYIGEKLTRSHGHADKLRQNYEKKYNCKIESHYNYKIIKINGRTVERSFYY